MKSEYIMREACFICSSPYQVIGAIGIQLAQQMDADIYIYGSFPEFELLAEKLGSYSVFRHVYAVNPREYGLTGKWRAIKETVFVHKYASRFIPSEVAYRTCYLSSRASLKTAQLKELLDRYPQMKRVFFEDGMGTYSESVKLLSVTNARRFIERLLGWKIDDPVQTSFMAYLPALVNYSTPFQDCKVMQMPRLPLDEKTQQMICDLFSVNEESEIREKVIIFDAKRHSASLLSTSQMELMDQCYDLVMKNLRKENIMLKPHPRSKENCSCAIKKYPYQGIPMEALYVKMPDIKDRILISFASTAVFTPKILFDIEAIVICLHRIVRDNRISKSFDPIFEKFRGTYRDSKRIIAPSSFAELESQLQKINEL